ncbi:MAG: VIT1/CCC1 transporter family protein [Acidobacteria bacterium]|nr:VIT1/CCC1 transporter family protein [Acidobacteriota bacterium]
MTYTHNPVHLHRDVQGGAPRALVFGVSDGLVSNVALILGVAAATGDASFVRVAGLSGLLAGAISMAAGEYVSVKAQTELIERELDIERRSLVDNPEEEQAELAEIYRTRGLDKPHAEAVAKQVHRNPETALDVHAREELGVDPGGLPNPWLVAAYSFVAFAVGAFLPLLPWLIGSGDGAVVASIVIGISAAATVGWLIAYFTDRSKIKTILRQVMVAVVACLATFAIASAVGTSV